MLFFVTTSHGDKLSVDIDIDMKIFDVNKMIYNQIENNQYIDTFDLILKHDLDVLNNNHTLRNYCIPERAKLLFVIKKKNIDIPSPSIYDSPIKEFENNAIKFSNNNVLVKSIENLVSMVETLQNDISDIKDDIQMIKNERLENNTFFPID